jgi:hypothetical protein
MNSVKRAEKFREIVTDLEEIQLDFEDEHGYEVIQKALNLLYDLL